MNPVQPQQIYVPIVTGQFEKIRDLGKGTFGTVGLYHYTRTQGVPAELRAVKIFHEYDETVFRREILPLLQLEHENIVLFYGLTDIAVFKSLVLEYMQGGNLKEVIYYLTPYRYRLKDLLRWNAQASKALDYMHSRIQSNDANTTSIYIHRDIKLENLLLDSTYQTLKICDFGLSRSIENSSGNTPGRGTPLYMAPEVLNGQHYNQTCDVYSWTLTFWECLTRVTPFLECKNLTELGQKKRIPNYLLCINDASEKFNKIIRSGSNIDRSKRLSMKSLNRLLANMLRNSVSMSETHPDIIKTIMEEKICVWNRLTDELFYCENSILSTSQWKKFDDNPLAIEEALKALPADINYINEN